MAIATINPATGETIKEFEPLTGAAVAQKLALAQQTFESYRHISMEQRASWLTTAADILQANKDAYGKLMTLEMGKPIAAAIAEVEKCAWVCRFYADHAAEFLQDTPIATDASHSFVRYQPLGVVLAVMPWNFPFWQVFRFAAPALMAGNVGLLKHASNVPQCALAIEDILTKAGFPEGAFQTLLVGADRVAQIIADDRVKAATLTGSEAAGASLASAAGKQIKKTVLELGGSDPFIVLESADLETAVSTAVTARMLNNGQSCIAAKRFIVQESIADAFAEKMTAQFAALKVGDPMHPETKVGPLATPTILQDLDAQVQACVQQGATVLIGGQPLTDFPSANYYPPTILTDLPPGCPAYQEEFFGPVALLFRVPDLDAAIQLANSTSFGLGASAWTQIDQERARLIHELEAGAVFINGLVKSDPRMPFGGIKRSGYGRELGAEGIREFVNVKTVWVK
jgi:succinate-semialdehyde dehydrogenase / glutarate-semialdehyde dehydrogenase